MEGRDKGECKEVKGKGMEIRKRQRKRGQSEVKWTGGQ